MGRELRVDPAVYFRCTLDTYVIIGYTVSVLQVCLFCSAGLQALGKRELPCI